MSGPASSKIEIPGVKVYIHRGDPATKSKVLNIDIESKELNKIIKGRERTYCGGKEGGIFIGLKKHMIKRAEKYLSSRKAPFL